MRTIYLWSALAIAGCALSSEDEPYRGQPAEDPAQEEFLDEHPDATSASGTWSYRDAADTLRLSIARSDIGCEFVAGATITFRIVALSDTTMATAMGDEESHLAVWRRQGQGSDIAGTWALADKDAGFLLTLGEDNAFLLSVHGFDGDDCDGPDNEPDSGYFTDDGCYVDFVDVGDVVADGDFADWDAVEPVADPADDSDDQASGDEITALYVAINDTELALRMSFAESITQGVRPSGNYTLGYETANGIGSIRIRYVDGSGEFAVFDAQDVDLAVAGQDLELTVPWWAIGGQAQLVRVSVSSTSDTPGADPLDDGPCFNALGEPTQE